MQLNNKFFLQNNIILKIILIFSFFSSWMSLGSSINDLNFKFDFEEQNLIYETINFLRTFINILSFIILSYFCVKLLDKKIFKNYFNFCLILLFYYLSQIPGLFLTLNNIENLYLIMSSLNIILIFLLVDKVFEYKEMKLFIYISVLVLSVLLILTFTNNLYEYLSGKRILFYGNPLNILDRSPIRSSGAGRLSLVILIFFVLVLGNQDNKRKIHIFFISFLSMAIILYQSRTNIVLWMIFILIYVVYINNYSFKKILENSLAFIVFPIILIYFLPHLKVLIANIAQDQNHFLYSFLINSGFETNNLEATSKDLIRKIHLHSSGRVEDWYNLFKNFDFNNNLFFGYGSQGDRFLIDQSASNGFVYSFVSSGIIGFFFYIIFIVSLFILLIKYFLYEIKKDQLSFSCVIIILIFLIRSLVESSFAVFGVDFILILMSASIIKKKIEKKI